MLGLASIMVIALFTFALGMTNTRAESDDGATIPLISEGDGNITKPGDIQLGTTNTNGQESQIKTTEFPNRSQLEIRIKKQKAKIISAKRMKNKKTRAKIEIKKVAKITGYQVKVSSNKKMKKYRLCTNKRNQITLKKLKVKKRYYIRARVYVKQGKKKNYGRWSGRKIIW